MLSTCMRCIVAGRRCMHAVSLGARSLVCKQAPRLTPSSAYPAAGSACSELAAYSTVMGSADAARPGVGSRPAKGSGGGCCASNSSHAFSKVTLMCAHISCRLWQACLKASVAEISPAVRAAPPVLSLITRAPVAGHAARPGRAHRWSAPAG